MRGRIGFFFVREKRCLPFHKEEGEKTREKTRKDDASRSVSIRSIRGGIKRARAGNDAGFFLLRLRRFRSAFFFSFFFFFSFIRLR